MSRIISNYTCTHLVLYIITAICGGGLFFIAPTFFRLLNIDYSAVHLALLFCIKIVKASRLPQNIRRSVIIAQYLYDIRLDFQLRKLLLEVYIYKNAQL